LYDVAPILDSPSMVVMNFPSTARSGSTQERVAAPSMCTMQAPHNAMPQPNLVPVIPRWSRSTHNSGVSVAHQR